MKGADIYQKFCTMFPFYAEAADGYKKIGSKTIKLEYTDNTSLIFMYKGDNDWTFGTRVWRRKPVKKV